MVEGNRGGEGRGTGARGSDFVVVRIENSIKFRLGVDLTPPNLIRQYFLKSSKGGWWVGGRTMEGAGRVEGGWLRKGNHDLHGNQIYNHPF